MGYVVAAGADCTSQTPATDTIAAATDDGSGNGGTLAEAARPQTAGKRSQDLPSSGIPAVGRLCLVVRVIDGDTIECDGGERVRLLMIDTPERSQGPYGNLATRALQALIDEQPEITLELDVVPKDRYGRTLAYLWRADGRMLNEEMARSGFAVALVYPPNVRYDERIRAAVQDARDARRGLWSTEAFQCEPIEHRRGNC